MLDLSLRPVIKIIEENCVNCHRCISVCPVKMCNNGFSDVVQINSNLCIGCGECLEACAHDARVGIDDADIFFQDLKEGKKIIAVVAPAIASSFEGKYLQVNGMLSTLGVFAFFDVSFGAELTVKTYLEYKKAENPRCVIAQPCPTLVSFIELYRPELLPLLAPADSPMVHTMKMIRHFYTQYKDYKIAVISPCYSKKREFDETGIGDYNITFKSLQAWLDSHGESISRYPERGYDNPPAERAVLFSTPGGLLRTAERYLPGISERTRKIEGQPQIYNYLAHLGAAIIRKEAPIHEIIDCLNCEMGCNGGPGTMNRGKLVDVIEGFIEKRNILMKSKYAPKNILISKQAAKKKLESVINKYWVPGLYARKYIDRSAIFKTSIRKPTEKEINEIHERTHKKSNKDILNCSACGYNSCEQMAVAIINKLNKPENCRQYMSVEVSLLHDSHKQELSEAISSVASESVGKLQKNMKDIQILVDGSTEMATCVIQSSASIEQMVANINSITRILEESAESVGLLEDASARGKTGITNIAALINEISAQSDSLAEASSVIKKIASSTNLLAMNAAIEAAHAGSYGQGFAVVADEIRNLAQNAGNQANSISKSLKHIKGLIDKTETSSKDAKTQFEQIVTLTIKVRDEEDVIKRAATEQSLGGKQVLEALGQINEITMRVNEESIELLSSSTGILSEIQRLSTLSKESAQV
jgi:iron only hydrogenase large subunit-like protein